MKSRLSLVMLLVVTLALSGCGKLTSKYTGGQQSQQRGSLKIAITIPSYSGMTAQSFLDEIELAKVDVTLTKVSGDTVVTASADIDDDDNTAELLVADLDPGEWAVAAVVKDTGNYSIYDGAGAGIVTAGATETVELKMDPTPGDLVVNVAKPETATKGTVALVSFQGPSQTKELTLTDGAFTATFEGLVPAIRTLQISLENDSNKEVASGNEAVNILPGRINEVTATASVTVGKLDIKTTWNMPPAPPTGLTATQVGKNVELSWTASVSDDVTGYSVFRAENQTGLKKLIARVSGQTTTHTDTTLTQEGTYWYWVVAESDEGLTSVFSAAKSLAVYYSRIVYIRLTDEGLFQLFLTNPRGADEFQLTNFTDYETDYPAISPDGTKVAFSLTDGAESYHIWVIDIDGTNAKSLTSGSGTRYRSPAWSPDGAQLAFLKEDVNDELVQLCIMDAADGDMVGCITHDALPNPYGIGEGISWSPDGTKIAFAYRMDDISPYQICTIDTDGENLEQITTGLNDSKTPDWSPDGRAIAYASYPDGSLAEDIYVIDVATKQERRVTSQGNGVYKPTWSPDGSKLAADEYGAIVVKNSDGTGETAIITYGRSPDWGVDITF